MVCDVIGATLECGAYLWCEAKPFYIQRNHLDFPGLVILIIFLFAQPSSRTSLLTEGFFAGWNQQVFLVVVLFVSYMWCSSYTVKVLGPVAKQFASVASVVLTYFCVMLIFPTKPENRFDN